ncbi:MAG: PP2C family protein-serine/threonine phosphatase [Rhizobiaceae bacterium]|nr:PP2C family protein-serine/threonine phosphatase [Rhizobiaceae bacterium]
MQENSGHTGEAEPSIHELRRELDELRAENDRLRAELVDLEMLHQSTIEHGEAVEDQLAENNILLQKTQARLEAELTDAARYVFSILPEHRAEHPHTDHLLIPSTELGGDSFGYHDIDDDHIAFYLLDVCGHGVGAALLSVTVINVLRASALPNADFRDPPAVLAALNEAFPMEKQDNMFFTIWYGVYQRSSGRLDFSSAGHPPAIHLRPDADGAVIATELVTSGGMAVGTFPDMDYERDTVAVLPGDSLLILSDGTFEVNGPNGEMLSFQEFVDFVAADKAVSPVRVHEWVRRWNGDGPLPDDFSLLQVRF